MNIGHCYDLIYRNSIKIKCVISVKYHLKLRSGVTFDKSGYFYSTTSLFVESSNRILPICVKLIEISYCLHQNL